MSDIFESYKRGVDLLLEEMGQDHPDYNRVLDQRHRLIENIEKKEQHGDNPQVQSDRSEILHNLEKLAQNLLGKPFYKLYELNQEPNSHEPSSDEPQTEAADSSLTLAHNYITSACSYIMAMHQALQEASTLFQREEIWPTPCQNVILAFHKHVQPVMPKNLSFGSLEGILTFVNQQVHKLTGHINEFSPIGRDKSTEANQLRRKIREEIQKFPQCLKRAIESINSTSKSVNHPHKCVLENIYEKNIHQAN